MLTVRNRIVLGKMKNHGRYFNLKFSLFIPYLLASFHLKNKLIFRQAANLLFYFCFLSVDVLEKRFSLTKG